ncbi:unnamed protein product [Rhizophagus irregularis]|nr:unnamed protein product [Rhizophagus irregularis]
MHEKMENKRKFEIFLGETYNHPRKSMRLKSKPFSRLSQDEYLQKEIDKNKCEETNVSTNNYDSNNDVAQQSISNEASSTENKDEQGPVFSRYRRDKSRPKKPKSKKSNPHSGENTIIDQVEYSNSCDCQLLVSSLPCDCSKSTKNQNEKFDYEMIIKEDIPDKNPPIKAKKQGIIKKVKKVTKAIYNYCSYVIYGYESDEQSDDDLSNLTNSASSCWENAFNKFPFLKQFDPLAPKNPIPSVIYPYSSTLTNEPSNSTEALCTKCGLHYVSSNILNGTNSHNNNIREGNNNRHDFLPVESVSRHMAPQSSPKSLHLLVMFIAFDCNIGPPNFDNCHSLRYHPILRRFGKPIIDEFNALNFVHDSIMNCWANSWKVALVVLGEVKELNRFFMEIRKIFKSEILDIIFIQPSESSYSLSFPKYFNQLDISVAKNSYTTSWMEKYGKIMDNVIQKAYRDEDKIYFYNKDEPYYEFTNFYRAPIRKDFEEWPTTEHYFQAAKFKDRYIRNNIRFAYTAREAFTIARKNDFRKREDWESPIPPDNVIFKEGIMKEALWLKFTQHENLKYKLLSTGKVKIFEHTENDRYWGDGGKNQNGRNRLGIMLQELREMLMEHEKAKLIKKYNSDQYQKWFLSELKELKQFDDLIAFDDSD